MKTNLDKLEKNKIYIVKDGKIYEDEYDFFKNLHEEYTGIKDDMENWKQQLIEEAELKTGKEIMEEYRNGANI